MTLPELPTIEPNLLEVRFVMHVCRGCGATSDWYRADTEAERSAWDGDHARLGLTHCAFYQFTLARNTARVFLA